MTEHNQSEGQTREGTRPISVSARLGRLQFHNSGKFRVLQFADIQDGPKISKDTIRLIEASLDAARPDVAVFTGNQIAGYDPAYAATFRKRRWEGGAQRDGHDAASDSSSAARREAELDKTRALVRKTVEQFLRPLIEREVPFAVTYGNHDFQCGLDTADMDEIYREFPGCLNVPATSVSAMEGGLLRSCAAPISGMAGQQVFPCGPGTFALPVMDVDHTRNVLALVLADSGDYAREGGYGSPSREVLSFLEGIPRRIGARTLVFQHMPLPQYYDLLKPAESTAPGAIQGYRAYESNYYVMDDSKMQPGSYLGEGISCPDRDCGEYAMLRDGGACFGVAAGHDHRNGFVGELDGMMLVATPTCGFGSYGPAGEKRAVRLFEFDIRHPHHPRTQLLEFGELVGKPSSRKAYSYDIADVKSDTEGMNLLRKKSLWDGLRGLLQRNSAQSANM